MKGWLDKYGKELNANEGSSSAQDNWMGEGYSNVGRNYSPAWGGQFAMGGSLPGSVGFTYARTGSTPSNGKYAKKTLPSAENGMTYYQHGLDWKPRNISQNGDNIPSEDEWLNSKFYEGLSEIPTAYQYPGRIQNAEKRDAQMKNIFYTLMDQYKDPYLVERAMRAQNQSYGSDRLENEKLSNYFGYDYNDIQPENLQSYYQNYMKEAQPFLEQKKNGGWLDKYDVPQAQKGKYILPRYDMPRAASESTSRVFYDPITNKQKSTATVGQKNKDVKATMEAMGRAKQKERDDEKQRIAERKAAVAAKDKGTAFTLPTGETKKYEDMDAREKMYVSGKALEQRGRFNENEESFFDEWINPLSFIGGMAGDLATAPYVAKQTNSNLPYIGAIANPLIMGALGMDPLGSTINVGKKIGNKVGQSMESGLLSKTPKFISSQPEITRGPINFWEEPGFAERNPNFNINSYNNSVNKFGNTSGDIPPDLMPYIDAPPKQSGFPNPLAIADAVVPRINPFSFIEDGGDLMSMSPLNLVPGYGKTLGGKNQAFRKFGNSIQDVIERQALSPKGGSPLRIGKSQIASEGNWAATDSPWEKYPGVFEATFDFTHPERNIGMQGFKNRSGVLITDRQGNPLPEIPITEPGMSFNRRLPFSTRYVPIDKQKLIDNKFQLATFAPHLQSLAEKYAVGLGGAATLGAMGYPGAVEKYNQYTIDPIKNWTKEQWEDYQKSDVYKKFRELDKSVGLDFLYDKKKQGGVIKDDNGYWNPDNWGKTVEIGSPDITMEGVNQPLIGESKQTGEKKMMLPGQNYKFANTKQVIEKPLNKKSTKGWLDKYN